mgnify:CR=1 FL=1
MDYKPCYLEVYQSGRLAQVRDSLLKALGECHLCPRDCGVNRLKGELGFCQTPKQMKIASYSPHFGEESPLVGRHGSGTIFVSSCNLLCVFCQNYEISHLREGQYMDAKEVAHIMLALQQMGCHNINIVTPSHVVPMWVEALVEAIPMGLSIPIVYNTSAYDSLETIKALEGIVDIYMPDFKFWSEESSKKYLRAADYPQVAREVIKEMHRQVGDLKMDERGIAIRGLLVRHLVMPGLVHETKEIMRFLAEEISKDTYVNVMDQYRPCGNAYSYPEISRRLMSEEYKLAIKYAKDAGLHRLDPRVRFFMVF